MKRYVILFVTALLLFTFTMQTTFASSGSAVLMRGMSGLKVTKLQQDLKTLGFFNVTPTGYFGSITEVSVKSFQKNYGITTDGIVGPITYGKINSLLNGINTKTQAEIIIDPGHGGVDVGTSWGNMLESSMNLAISKKLQSYLNRKSHNAVMTRTTDTLLNGYSSVDGDLELRDLSGRTNIINNSGAKLLVSIHVNSYPESPDSSGSIVYYNDKYAQSKTLAAYIQKALNNMNWNNRKRTANGIQEANFHVLRNANIPGVLVETGFITNKQDRQLLDDDGFKDNLAQTIANAVDTYMTSQK